MATWSGAVISSATGKSSQQIAMTYLDPHHHMRGLLPRPCQEAIKENSCRVSTLLLVQSFPSLWQMLQTQEVTESHWEIMVELQSTHSKSHINDIYKRSLVNWAELSHWQKCIVNPPCQRVWPLNQREGRGGDEAFFWRGRHRRAGWRGQE